MAELNFSSLEVLSTAIQFAPVALLIVCKERRLRRANKMAEAILGVDAAQCQGQPFSRWVTQDSWTVVANSFDLAADAKWSQGGGAWSMPSPSAVTLQTRVTGTSPPGKPFQASLSCSSCFTDSQYQTQQPTKLDGKITEPEPWYILSIIAEVPITPTASVPEAELASDTNNGTSLSRLPRTLPVASLLRDRILDSIGYPLIALSADGRTSIANRLADLLLRSISDLGSTKTRDGEYGKDIAKYAEGEVDLDWLFAQFTLCDPETWIEKDPQDYPLYKVAVKGQRFRGDVVGALTKHGQNKKLIECDGFPMYDDTGRFLGGMLVMADVTEGGPRVGKPRPEACPPFDDLEVPSSLFRGFDFTSSDMVHITRLVETFTNLTETCGIASYTVSAEGDTRAFNKAWYDLTGISQQDSAGVAWDHIHTEDLYATKEIISRGIISEQGFEYHNRVRRKDGVYQWVMNRITPLKTEAGRIAIWLGMIINIDELVNELSADREARDTLTDALQVADITLWSVQPSGILELVEGSLASSLTTSAQGRGDGGGTAEGRSIIGRSIYEEWGESQRKPIEQALAGAVVFAETTVKGRSYRTQYRPTRANTNASASFVAMESQTQGPVLGVTGLSFDITERLEMERKFAESAKEVTRAESASHAAEEASKMKSEFLAVISHEIRTPLHGVIGLAELLLDIETLPEDASSLIHSVLRSSGALLTVVDDLLDFSKVEAGKMDLTPSGMSLRTVCQDAMFIYERLWASKGLAFDVDITQLPDEVIWADAGRVAQVLNNLFGNAGKFTDKGKITFIAVKIPSSSGTTATSQYSFTITDTGCGIAKAQQTSLFQPFRQADPSTSRRYGGSGLGLAICRTLVELMGGEISLESQEGVGTTVHLTIPFALYEPSPDEPPITSPTFRNYLSSEILPSRVQAVLREEETAFSNGPTSSDLRASPAQAECKGLVLLAEDNPLNARIAAKTLRRLEYDVECATNGLEVLKLLEEEKDDRKYALILMDVMMPLQDGYECTRLIRSEGREHHRRLPIIACTAAVVNGRSMSEAAGMSDFLGKPMRRNQLAAMLDKWMGRLHDD